MVPYLLPIQLGRMSYTAALRVQHYFARLHLNALKGHVDKQAENVLLLVEHDPVYTIGLRTSDYTIKDEDRLRALGAEFHKTDRGGLITFHGHGQLVVYPIINLKHFKIGMRDYVCKLEQSVITMCAEFGISANTSPHTGVWVGGSKITAIGIHGSRYITTHGLAVNCDIDLSWFSHIVPCGIPDHGVTSLSTELGRTVSVTEAQGPLLRAMGEKFICDVRDVTQFKAEAYTDFNPSS